MSSNDRWNLYHYWLQCYKQKLIEQLVQNQKNYQKIQSTLIEMRDMEDIEIMRRMLVVGMTTTAAARLQTSLQILKCPIVVVEEAAEVLESHITVSLTNHCQHLILIGDHQQLRPATADYEIETDYKLGISMFERMIINKFPNHILNIQHRMRPEISQLISPNIYPDLQNHSSVYKYPSIMGVDKSLFFIDHSYPEDECQDLISKSNKHEVQFLIELALHLLKNGYAPNDITILAAYSAQYFLFREKMRKIDALKSMPLNILDNYQGEESKIILLSLVRNNQSGNIGFLRLENRVCVALSRAREGLYIMGNMTLFCQKAEIWRKIRCTLESQDACGSSLGLRCQIHKDIVTQVKMAKDFAERVPGGGCDRLCKLPLECGHTCIKTCHILNREHKMMKCEAVCSKILCKDNHKCPKLCYENCGLCMTMVEKTLRGCGHRHNLACSSNLETFQCPTLVEVKLPCNHTVVDKPCHKDIECYKCPFKCAIPLPCGHSCNRQCHLKVDPDHKTYKCFENCQKVRVNCSSNTHLCNKKCYEDCLPCNIMVKKQRSHCNHWVNIHCSKSVDETLCKKPCKRNLICGHPCKMKCFEDCGGCIQIVDKVLPECGHSIKTRCDQEPDPKACRAPCLRNLPCGHVCQSLCGISCTKECDSMITCIKSLACSHTVNIEAECRIISSATFSTDSRWKVLSYCSRPCMTILKCGHKCSGTCGSCLQGRIHKRCQEKCNISLICGHTSVLLCGETPQPCYNSCLLECKHQKCKKRCAYSCWKCYKQCARKCNHSQCTTKCEQICKVLPCDQPCSKLISCGHPCIGFCGDPCPSFCRICNKKELAIIAFGSNGRDHVDNRFIFLKECGHLIESKQMDTVIQNRSTRSKGTIIRHISCPQCGILITSTQRYKHIAKEVKLDVDAISQKYMGSKAEVTALKEVINLKLNELACLANEKYLVTDDVLGSFHTFLVQIQSQLSSTSNCEQFTMNFALLKNLQAKVMLLENLLKTLRLSKFDSLFGSECVDYLTMLLARISTDITKSITLQELEDFNREFKRLSYLLNYYQLSGQDKTLPNYTSNIDVATSLLDQIQKLIFTPTIFDNFLEDQIVIKLSEILKEIKKVTGVTLRLSTFVKLDLSHLIDGGLSNTWYKCNRGHFYALSYKNSTEGCIECQSSTEVPLSSE